MFTLRLWTKTGKRELLIFNGQWMNQMLDFKGDKSTLGMIFKNLIPNWRPAYHSWQRQYIKTTQTGQVNFTEHSNSAVLWNANVDLRKFKGKRCVCEWALSLNESLGSEIWLCVFLVSSPGVKYVTYNREREWREHSSESSCTRPYDMAGGSLYTWRMVLVRCLCSKTVVVLNKQF